MDERNSYGERLYKDITGAKCNLRGMMGREPGWVVSRFNRMEEVTERCQPIIDERARQDAKWGPQTELDLPMWLAILMEEVGELAAACLCHRFGNDDHPELDWRKEAIQVAAVALSMTEQYKEPDDAANGS